DTWLRIFALCEIPVPPSEVQPPPPVREERATLSAGDCDPAAAAGNRRRMQMSIQGEPAQKRARQKVAATLLAEAVAAGGAAVLVCDDEQLRYVAVNEAACALTGYSRDELLRMRASDLFPLPEERLHEGAKRVMGGAVHVGGGLLQTKDGEIVEIGYISERTRLDALDGFIVSLCWRLARERGQTARRRAAELREEAEALRAQATVQLTRTQRV